MAGSVNGPDMPAVSKPDAVGATVGRSGWPVQLNIVDVSCEQTGKCFTYSCELKTIRSVFYH